MRALIIGAAKFFVTAIEGIALNWPGMGENRSEPWVWVDCGWGILAVGCEMN